MSIGTWSATEHVYIDTGHEGGLVIPADLEDEILALPTWMPYELADGHVIDAATWSSNITIEGRPFVADIVAMGRHFLLGRDVLDSLTVCFERGRRLTIEF